MAKDYFQDIMPPSDGSGRQPPPITPKPSVASQTPPASPPVNLDAPDDEETQNVPIRVGNETPRGIRSIPAPRQNRSRVGGDMREVPMSNMGAPPIHSHNKGSARRWLWIAALLGIIIVIGLVLVSLRETTVTVTPRAHTIVLTNATSFIAYPAATAATGTLTYTVQTTDLDDSEVVAASGTTTTSAAKASGDITVYNAYSASSVSLIKNTRFETPDGLIFRVPANIVIPGEKGAAPGKVQVTVVADQTGEQYNIGPLTRFTIPGLKSNAAMYANVYASSAAPMTGGSSGSSGPGVAPSALSAAVSDLQNQLQAKANDAATAQAAAGEMVLPSLIQITYTSEPNTTEAGGGVRVHETAHVEIPIFSSTALGEDVGSAVSADSDNEPVTLVPGSGFSAQIVGTAPNLGTDPLQFTLSGQAQLLWSVDTAALASDLAGRDQGAFQTVIAGFPGIVEAHAKVEPFWKSTFPSNPDNIKVVVTAPVSE